MTDPDRMIQVADPIVYWAAFEASAMAESEHTVDFEAARLRAHELAVERGKVTRVMRDAYIVSTVYHALPDGSGHMVTACGASDHQERGPGQKPEPVA